MKAIIIIETSCNAVPTKETRLFSRKQKDEGTLQPHEYKQQVHRQWRQYYCYYRDTSSLAPKKNLSLPKPVVSGIFRCEKYTNTHSES